MIVIADDDIQVQQSCRYCLEKAGYQVRVVTTGFEALRAANSSNVSAVLLDIFMPEMDGIETLLSLKKDNPLLPVIVMTGGGARVRLDFLDVAKKLGADEIISKPFTSAELLNTVKRWA